MGLLDAFRKKKDEFGDSNEFSNTFNDPNQSFPPQEQSFQDPFSQQPQQNQYNPYPSQQPLQQGFTPEQMGFERVQQNSSPSYGSSNHNQTITEINIGKDFEIINAKLDAIKAELDSINQRIKRIERMNETDPTAKKDQWF